MVFLFFARAAFPRSARTDGNAHVEKEGREEVPILVLKGRRSRAELRSEGCAGALHAEPLSVGSEVAFVQVRRRRRTGAPSRANAPRNAKSKCLSVNRVASQPASLQVDRHSPALPFVFSPSIFIFPGDASHTVACFSSPPRRVRRAASSHLRRIRADRKTRKRRRGPIDRTGRFAPGPIDFPARKPRSGVS